MKLQSFIMYWWSSLATKVWLFEISSSIPCVLNSIQSSYYLEAGTNSHHIEPTEELKRTQRSFLKKIWKDSGLQYLFGDNGCVNCCNNDNYNVGEGDTYETPPTSSYTRIPYFQQIPPLNPLQPLDPLKIFEPFLRPMDFNTNGPNGGGHIKIYDKSNIPKRYEGENSNVINDDYIEGYSNKNSGASEGTDRENIKEYKVKDNNDYSRDKSNNKYTETNCKIYDETSKDGYQNTQPAEDVYVYPEPKSKTTQMKQTYPSVNDSSGSIVYQPIIYVSPQYHVAPPIYNSAHNCNQKSEESDLYCPNSQIQHHVYTNEKEEPKSSPSLYNNFKWRPEIQVTYSDPSLPCSVYPHSTVLSNKEYTPLPPSALLPPRPSTYGVVSQCSDTKVRPSDIAIYTILKQIPSAFALSSQVQTFNANGNYKELTPPIILTEADQPYRNCPELFTDYLNQGNCNHNYAKSNTFVNAQIISC